MLVKRVMPFFRSVTQGILIFTIRYMYVSKQTIDSSDICQLVRVRIIKFMKGGLHVLIIYAMWRCGPALLIALISHTHHRGWVETVSAKRCSYPVWITVRYISLVSPAYEPVPVARAMIYYRPVERDDRLSLFRVNGASKLGYPPTNNTIPNQPLLYYIPSQMSALSYMYVTATLTVGNTHFVSRHCRLGFQ